MWQQSYTITVPNLKPNQVWQVWADVPNRPAWDDDTQWAKANGPFENGTVISMKPKGWPKVVFMTIINCVPNQSFTDCTQFLFAKLYGIHHMQETANGLTLTTTIKITGMMSWFWRRIVGQDIVNTLPHQTAMLIKLAKTL